MSLKAAPGPAGCFLTDIEGSTRRWEKNPTAMQAAVARHDAIIQSIADRHGGDILDRAGDGTFVLLKEGNPLICALEVQLALAHENWDEVDGLPVRIGVHAAGLDGEGRPDRVAANRAARITDCAWGGQILVSEDAMLAFAAPPGAQLVDLGAQHLRGVAGAMRLYGLTHPDLPQQSFPPPRARHEWAVGLPAETGPLFGRERELADLEAAIEEGAHSLITIVAAGGTGKTRLLVELSRRVAQKRPVCFVSLQAAHPVSLAVTLARSLQLQLKGGQDVLDQLIQHLHRRDLVLALDSAENAPEADALVQKIIESCPSVMVLASSRAPLGVAGEHLFRLGGLDCRGPELAHVRTSPAYRLFAEQAARFAPEFSLEPADAVAFHKICDRIGGSPLALKLTARWRSVLSLPQIEERLSQGLDFLASVQQRSGADGGPRSVFEGAWRLLSQNQQLCLARLSVFVGGFEVADGEVVTEMPASVFLELEDRGLIQREKGGRFDVHALIGEYARERLEEDKTEARRTQRRHAEHFVSLLQAPLGPEQSRLLDKVEQEQANIEIAWRYVFANDDETLTAERLEALFYLLVIRSRFHEGEKMFAVGASGEFAHYLAALRANCLVHIGKVEQGQALALSALENAQSAPARAHALQALGNGAHLQGRLKEAQRRYEEALELRGQDLLGKIYTCLSLGWLDLAQNNPASARRWVRESYRTCRQSGDTAGLMRTYMLGADVAVSEGRLEDARANFAAALELEELVREPANRAAALARLAAVLIELDEHVLAAEHASEAIELSQQVGEERMGAIAKIERARASHALGDAHAARRDLVAAFRAALKLKAAPLLARALSELSRIEHAAGNYDYAARLSAALGNVGSRTGDAPTEAFDDVRNEIEGLMLEAELAQARL